MTSLEKVNNFGATWRYILDGGTMSAGVGVSIALENGDTALGNGVVLKEVDQVN